MGKKEADLFMEELLNDIDSAPLPSSSSSNDAKVLATTRFQTRRDPSATPSHSASIPPQNSIKSIHTAPSQGQVLTTPSNLSLSQLSKLAFHKPSPYHAGSSRSAPARGRPAGAFGRGDTRAIPAATPSASHQVHSKSSTSSSSRLPTAGQRPREARPPPSSLVPERRPFSHANSDSQLSSSSVSNWKAEQYPKTKLQATFRSANDERLTDDTFANDADDDAWIADLDEAALTAPVAAIKKEEVIKSTSASNTASSSAQSVVKRVSRTQSKLWAQRAKTSQSSRSTHRSYIRCRVLDVRESTYQHSLPNSTRTVERPEKIIFCVEKPRRGAQYREDEALEGELPLATWDGRSESARKRKIVLREEWTATRVAAGNYVHCVGHWADEPMNEDDERVEREYCRAQLVAEDLKKCRLRDQEAVGALIQQIPADLVKSEGTSPEAKEEEISPSSFNSDEDLFADMDEDLLMDDDHFDTNHTQPARTIPTMRLLSSSPLSDSPHADNLLILHPDILVTATAVCDVPTCVRKPLVRQRINGTGASDKMSEALVMGCMLHEVLQACLTGSGLQDDSDVPDFDEASLIPFLDMPFPLQWYGPGRTNFSLSFVIKQAKLQVLHNLDGLLCCGMETSSAEAKLLDLCRPFGEFSKRYLEDTLAVTRAENGTTADVLQGLFRGVNGMLEAAGTFKEDATVIDSRTTVPTLARVTHVFDVEEEIWSPMYGLKGKMDVSVEVELQETEVERPAWRGGNHFIPGQQQRSGTDATTRPGVNGGSFYRRTQSTPTTGPLRRTAMNRYSSIMPMEIKTGKSVDALEHRAQTMLYTLMMSDRYGTDVNSGLLYYTRSGDMHRVRRTRNEVRGLIVGRNELAFWMKRDGKDEEETSDQRRITRAREGDPGAEEELEEADEGHTALPPTIDNDHECNRCFAQDGCMLYRKTIDRIIEDEDNPSEIASLYDRITSHLTPSQTAFYQKWERLLSLEEDDMVKFKRELWTLTAAAREEIGRCFANMVMEPRQNNIGSGTGSGEVHAHTYRFVRKPMDGSPGQLLLGGSITAGDPCVVSIEPGMFSVAQGYIVEVSPKSVTIGLDHHLDAILERAAVEQGQEPSSVSNLDITFRIDRDEYSDGMAKIRFQLSRLFFSTSERDSRHRELIVDLSPPRFDFSSTLKDEDLPDHLNEDQRAAMRRVIAAEDYSLILGMPGTGKTTTIAELIKLLVARGKTILLASYTHSAVDTILRKLLNVPEVRLLRLGNVDRVHADLQHHTLPKVMSVEALDEVINTPNVIATTCLSTGHATFARRKFDYCIVDEASQITLPTCLGPLRFADKFVLVGDHFQLPPLVRNSTARAGGLDISLFKRLSDAHSEAVVYLTRQYRMNETIMMLSNHLIYDGLLKCGNDEVAKQVLALPYQHRALADIHTKRISTSQNSNSSSPSGHIDQPSSCPSNVGDGSTNRCWLAQLMDPSCAAVFVDTDDVPGTESRRGRMVQNHVEAGVIQQLARSLIIGGVPPGDIAVITPYRQQLKLLQSLLIPPRLSQMETTSRRSAAAIKREAGKEASGVAGGEIEILTADRSQGRDKPVVLISLVRSNDLGVRGVGELLNDWRRINVAFTRAQRKIVIVGSQKTLSAAPLLEDFFSLMREQGWIHKLPKGALDMHPAAAVIPTNEVSTAADEDEGSYRPMQSRENEQLTIVKQEDSDSVLFPDLKAPGFVSASPHASQDQSAGSSKPLEMIQPLSQNSQSQNEEDHDQDSTAITNKVLGKRKDRSLNNTPTSSLQPYGISEEDKEQMPPSPDLSQEAVVIVSTSSISPSKSRSGNMNVPSFVGSQPTRRAGTSFAPRDPVTSGSSDAGNERTAQAKRQAAAEAKGEALLKRHPIIRDAILASQED